MSNYFCAFEPLFLLHHFVFYLLSMTHMSFEMQLFINQNLPFIAFIFAYLFLDITIYAFIFFDKTIYASGEYYCVYPCTT